MRFLPDFGYLLGRRGFPLAAGAIALLLTLPALWVGWQADDDIHRFVLRGSPHLPELTAAPTDLFALVDGNPQRNARLMDVGVLPWWSSERLRLAFWRPLSGLTHWLDYRLWPNHAALMHAHSLLWYVVAVVVAGFLYRRIIGATWIAGLAALLYAIDDAHGLPAGWIANRNALISITLGLAALLAHDRWRRTGWRPGAVVGPLALLAALLAGEAAVGAAAYLLAYALQVDTGSWRGRLGALLPHVGVGIAWWITYQSLGYGAAGSGMYADPAQAPLRFLVTALERMPVLLLGQWGPVLADTATILSPAGRRVLWLFAAAYLTLVLIALIPVLRRDARARFFAIGMLLSVLPVCSTFPSDRLLLFVGFGAMGLLGLFLGGLRERAPWDTGIRRWRSTARTMAVVLIGVHVVLAPLLKPLRAWSPVLFGVGPRLLAESAPRDAALRHQDLILVNPPSMFAAGFLPILRALDDAPVPAHTRVLASGTQPLEVKRVDERTLAVRPALGFVPAAETLVSKSSFLWTHVNMAYLLQYLDRLYCDGRERVSLGHRVELTGMRVEVTALTADGRPAEATFRFAVPLEDASLRWMRCENGAYVPFAPPAVGETIRLSAVSLRPARH